MFGQICGVSVMVTQLILHQLQLLLMLTGTVLMVPASTNQYINKRRQTHNLAVGGDNLSNLQR